MSLGPLPHHFLLVENDPHEADILAKAFAAIPDCGTVSVARKVSEARAYLIGAGIYADRKKFQLPQPSCPVIKLMGILESIFSPGLKQILV